MKDFEIKNKIYLFIIAESNSNYEHLISGIYIVVVIFTSYRNSPINCCRLFIGTKIAAETQDLHIRKNVLDKFQ